MKNLQRRVNDLWFYAPCANDEHVFSTIGRQRQAGDVDRELGGRRSGVATAEPSTGDETQSETTPEPQAETTTTQKPSTLNPEVVPSGQTKSLLES